ncbi:MAG: ATP-binding protein [Deltaproteobacteria bacterium]|jgi:hypothetical protein|nr:ATP-binding protein [Deltaproteobacteria bacterium]
MAMKFITPETDRRMTCLVIGRAGIGKTSLLRTVPPDENVFVISAESGLLCVQDLVRAKRVVGIEVEGIEDLDEALWNLKTPKYRAAFRWVFVDSLTEISERFLIASRKKYPDRRDSFNMWDDYERHFMAWVRQMRDLQGYDVVLTCLEVMDLDAAQHRIVNPNVQLKRLRNGDNITGMFDEVFYMTDVQDETDPAPRRVLITVPFNNRPGKDRGGTLAPVEPPDLAHIKRKILGGES